MDEQGLTWLHAPAKIKLLANPLRRQPYPLNWDEQSCLIHELPAHLAEMALFAVNIGDRAAEICALQWQWEVQVPEMDTSFFIVPWARVKNSDERLVVLNQVARSVIEGQRHRHATHVFTFSGAPVRSMLNTAWKKARLRAGLPMVRVHDLKHTFERRLRAAGVSFEVRQELLGHSAAELYRLIEAAERVVARNGQRPELGVLRGRLGTNAHKMPTKQETGPEVRRLTR
jgi:integrase